MVIDMNSFELTALEYATQGSGRVLQSLREQIADLAVASREFTGVGFFTSYSKLGGSTLVPCSDFAISDVFGKSTCLEHGFGIIVFVRGGQIDTLEAFTFGEDWPDMIEPVRLSYMENELRDYDDMLTQNKA